MILDVFILCIIYIMYVFYVLNHMHLKLRVLLSTFLHNRKKRSHSEIFIFNIYYLIYFRNMSELFSLSKIGSDF